MIYLEKSREQIQDQFQKKEREFPEIVRPIREQLLSCEEDLAVAVQYLYTAAPLSDLVNVSFETMMDYAQNGLQLWRELERVRELPEQVYLNYVLSHRVNEEEILPCRSLFREKLSGRIGEKSVKEAAIEVNFWCAEEATYQSGDDRTLPALTVYRRGYGRCGEESTFLVNALRSVGIPARQVYVPRWSHCDDNHAWAELWIDGSWYFTGACEPLMILNKGWFTNASSRAMIVHSRLFGEITQYADGEFAGREGAVTMLNQLARYAATKRIRIHVTDRDGSPVEGAEVSFQIFNYAEYYSAACVKTDREGNAELLTGLGTLRIQVNFGCMNTNGNTAEANASGRDLEAAVSDRCPEIVIRDIDTRTAAVFEISPGSGSCVIKSGSRDGWQICGGESGAGAGEWRAIDVTAPVDTPVNKDMPTAEQKLEGDRRLAEADRIRKQKKESWENPERRKFLEREDFKELRAELLGQLSDKDQTDCIAEVLEEHLSYALPYCDKVARELFIPYVLNPRVEFEVLRRYRKGISEFFTGDQQTSFRENPKLIWETIRSRVRTYPQYERASVITTPYECLYSGTGSERSMKVLFVAIARTFGIPARLNPEDHAMEYWDGTGFVPVIAAQEKTAELLLESTDEITWNYTQNWGLARLTDGAFVSLDLSRMQWKKDGGQQSLRISLLPGMYRIITANRLPNGNVFTLEKEFVIADGETKTEHLRLRDAELADMLEEICLPEFKVRDTRNEEVSSEQLTDGAKKILIWLEESREPTEHILNEMMEQCAAFKQYERDICFVIRDEAAKQDPTLKKALNIFDGIHIYYDSFEENIELLGRRMYVDPERLPLILVTNGRQNGIYAASGYNVGTGEMLLRIMREV